MLLIGLALLISAEAAVLWALLHGISCPANTACSAAPPASPQIGRYLSTGSEGVSLYVDVSACRGGLNCLPVCLDLCHW